LLGAARKLLFDPASAFFLLRIFPTVEPTELI
jgi:hypothetical protein